VPERQAVATVAVALNCAIALVFEPPVKRHANTAQSYGVMPQDSGCNDLI
jgi:hypothetical protein